MKIKYMGTADVRRIEKGADWGGRLADKLTSDVVWDWDNNHTIDTEELDLSEEAVELILEDPDMKDVTDLKRIPTGGAEAMWKGVKQASAAPEGVAGEAGPTGSSASETGGPGGRRTRAGGSTAGGAGTTTGGST
jgi:hypothetical protein